MKIFVFGSTGMLGTYVTKYFSINGYEAVSVNRKNIDITKITDEMLMRSTIGEGDVVINCAGLIKQRAGTTEYDFIKINSMFPHMLAMTCEAKGAKLIHVSTDCFLPNTSVLTVGGYRSIQDLCVGDTVYTHIGKLKEVKELSSREVNEEIYTIKTLGNDIVKCTSNHPWFSIVRKYKQKPKFETLKWNRTNLLCVGSLIAIPKLKAPEQTIDFIDLTNYCNKYSEDIRHYELFMSNVKDKNINIKKFCNNNNLPLRKFYVWNSNHIIKPKSFDKQKNLCINKDTSWFLGLFLAEGWVDNKKHRKTITISLGNEPKIINRVVSIIKKYLNVDPILRRFKSQKGTQITFTHQFLSEMLSQEFYTDANNKYSHTKKVPEWIKYIGESNIKSLLLGYFEGDGCFYEKGHDCFASMSSVSEILIDDIKVLFMMCGVLPMKSVQKKLANVILGRKVNAKIAYRLCISGAQLYKVIDILNIKSNNITIFKRYQKIYEDDNYWFVPIKTIIKENYNGIVYNMEVEDDHSYLVSGGLSAHNCVFDGVVGCYNELDPHNATDIYGRSKSLGEPLNATVIRTSIIGEEKQNFLSLLEWVKSNKDGTVNGFTNHYWNGITCLKFAEICDYIIKNNLFWSSVKHIFSPSVISKCELVQLISDIYDLNISVIPTEGSNKCDRSLTTTRKSIIIPIESLKEQILKMKQFEI
jgi:dTDP-4-dehydrorhamnose reductase/intein/homing endonuclease